MQRSTPLSREGASSTDAIPAPEGVLPRRSERIARQNLELETIGERDEFVPSSFSAAQLWGQPPAHVANLGHAVPSKYHSTQKITKAHIAAQTILQDLWTNVDKDVDLQAFITRDYWHPNLVDLVDPRILEAKASKYNED